MGRFDRITYNDILVCLPCMKLRDGKSPMWQLTLDTNVEDLANSLYEHRDKYHHDMFIGDMWEFASNLEMSQRMDRYKNRLKDAK